MAKSRIIVIGGGFGGVKCASTLRKHLSRTDFEVVLFAEENHMVFDPLLAEVAAAAVNPKDMAAPLRELLPGVRTRLESIRNLDFANKQVEYLDEERNFASMSYEQLVIACGNTSNLAIIPGMADHAFPLKNVGDALALQAHVIAQLEKAEVCNHEHKRNRYLTFVIVGGGFSGVELAGELNDLVKRAAKYYSNFKASDVSVTLVHSQDQILPEVSSSLRVFAQREMEKHGVKFLLNTRAVSCTADGVKLEDGTFLKAGTIACTIGSRPLAMIERLSLPKNRGRLVTEPDMSLPGFPDVWAIGDCAAVMNTDDNQLSPTTGQFAERQGAQAAMNVVARIHGNPTKPFKHKSLGMLCSIGGKKAVAEMMGLKIAGFPAWFAWRGVYLMKLPAFGQKLRVGIDWMFDLVLPPALTSLQTDSSKRIGNAHFAAGDVIYRKGEPASDFFVIESGQVELYATADGKDQIVGALGQGDFFGESALMDEKGVRDTNARAGSDTEVLVMGKNVFDQISQVLTPFKEALGAAMKRRTSLWTNYPELREIVGGMSLKDVMEPPTAEPLRMHDGLMESIQRVNSARLDFVFVVDDAYKLTGLVTRSDLLRAIEVAAACTCENRANIKAKDIMVPAEIFVSEDDDLIYTISVMRERGFKRLPVLQSKEDRKLLGQVRVENIMERIMRALPVEDKQLARP